MSIEKVKAYFAAFGMEDRILEFPVSSATVELAAQALNCEGCRIVKTLSFHVNGKAILICAAGDAKVDNAKYKARFGVKAKMLSHEEAATMIGYAVGGVCPFGVNAGVKVYLDDSLRRFDKVYPAAGTAASAVELTVEELERASCALSWVDVTKL